ncbi:ISL3 family transposase [Nocardiopsis valliformis]|uniref:ISL3 family transposase n=1 Tax=Nocardiopsis valliformis TaxID=239974 RepID=UPI00034B6D53|nr:ISL3 family transposase [Nocardiopsis valliformis]
MDEVCSWLTQALFPENIDITVTNVETTEKALSIEARASGDGALSPDCSRWSQRVHGSYWRNPADLPAAGLAVRLRLLVRRFLCPAQECDRRTFTEQVHGLTRPHSRWTERLRAVLSSTGLALAGRAAARLLGAHLAIPVSRSTVLRQVTERPVPFPGRVRVVGLDEFALRKGRVYGTVLVDVETHRPIDLLPDRETQTVTAWLRQHPEIEVVYRDRATFHAEAADQGAPQAVQVADRWHLWANLDQAVERCVSAHRTCLHAAPAESEDENDTAEEEAQAGEVSASPWPTGHRFADRVRETHAAVHDLLAKGHNHRSIQRHLGMGSTTVVRYARATDPQELFRGQWQSRSSKVDPYKPYLDQRWDEGCTNAWKLFEEVRERGYPGGYGMVRAYLKPQRSRAQPAGPKPPRAREVAGWIMCPPEVLDEEERLRLKHVAEQCPDLGSLVGHVRSFAQILTQHKGERLDQWRAEARVVDLPALRSFIDGLGRDLDAVRAGLTLPWSSGPVEGNVNRIKMLKRQMYGRAGFALLRKRVLLA